VLGIVTIIDSGDQITLRHNIFQRTPVRTSTVIAANDATVELEAQKVQLPDG
jgi:hypothetical protein